MILYEFHCKQCGENSDIQCEVGKSKRKCPLCGKLALERVFTVPNYHDTYSPMHPRRGRGVGGYGRIDPGEGATGMGKRLG